jgi:hypothetical protein
MGYWRFTTEFSGFGIWCRRLALPQKPLGHALADAFTSCSSGLNRGPIWNNFTPKRPAKPRTPPRPSRVKTYALHAALWHGHKKLIP